MINNDDDSNKVTKLREMSVPALTRSVPGPGHGQFYDDEPHLWDYLEVLLRRKWIVIIFLVTIVSTVTLAVFLMKPIYKSTATIHIKNTNPNMVGFAKDVYFENRTDEYYETQYKILMSMNLAQSVIAALQQHEENESMDQEEASSADELTASPQGTNSKMSTDENGQSISIGELKKGLEIVPVKRTQLVNINFLSHDPVIAAHVANTVVDEYIMFTLKDKLGPSQMAKERLLEEVEVMRVKLENSEQHLNDYVKEGGMMFLNKNQVYENFLTEKLSVLSEELVAATSDKITKAAIYKEVKNAGVEYTTVLKDPLIQSLTIEYANAESEYFKLLKIYKPGYPRMIVLKERIEKLKLQIQAEEKKIIERIGSNYTIAKNEELILSSTIQNLRQEVGDFQNKLVEFGTLKREVDTNRDLYNTLLKRVKEIGITAEFSETNVRILDKALVSTKPFKPKKVFDILLSVIAGLFGGIFLAFFVEYFDRTVKSVDDIEKESPFPILGVIPKAKGNPNELVSANSSIEEPLMEAFRSLSAVIRFNNGSAARKLFLITSPLPADGKTMFSVNLAKSMISTYGKGILIDADIRRPDIHDIYHLDNSIGLSSFLTGENGHDEIINTKPGVGFDIITSGPVLGHPSELLNSARMKELLKKLSSTYNYIIVDSPPVLGISDSLHLSSFIKNVIVVVRASITSRDAFQQAIKLLYSVNPKILGVVLNGLDLRRSYGYSYYYSYNGNEQSADSQQAVSTRS